MKARSIGCRSLWAAAPALPLLVRTSTNALGGSATWNLNPSSQYWGDEPNWTPATVPHLPDDIATFDVSNTTNILDVGYPSSNAIDGIVFNPGASAFTIPIESVSSLDLHFTFSGFGITNNSGIAQNFVTVSSSGCCDSGGVIQFINSATTGALTVFDNDGFYTATKFFDTSTAGDATPIAGDEGVISFLDDSTGGMARVKVTGTGKLDISAHNAPGVPVGSIEGNGLMTLGSNEQNTTISGMIAGAGGSLTKLRSGAFTLTNGNTYSGGTTVSSGALVVRNRRGSGTGSGPVQVSAGRLGGTGVIAGPVTIGTGSGSKAFISPGINGKYYVLATTRLGTLMLLSTPMLDTNATYTFELNRDSATADRVIANGVTIISGAQVSISDLAENILSSAELYDPATGTWTATGSMNISRANHTATLLPSGKVLVAGGTGGDASAELYDPASETWTGTGSLATARAGHTATLLPDSEVVAAGGFGTTNPYPLLASAELYVPASGTWTMTGRLTNTRWSHTATLLPNGKALVAGESRTGILPAGTVFTVISNTSATPINGTFANLPDGSTLTLRPNTYEASYSGGDGNDLTLTVIQ